MTGPVVNGTPTIALSVAAPRGVPGAQGVHLTLHNGVRTYQPLRTVTVVEGGLGRLGRAKRPHSVPAAYGAA